MPTLHWIGKDKVINHHMDVPFKVLEKIYDFGITIDELGKPLQENVRLTIEDLRLNDAEIVNRQSKIKNRTSGNMIIHGDNLEALKSLLPEYEGKVKCIYIDPPYNTGNESWVYNDNVNDPKIKKWLGQVVGKEAEDLTRHDKWLCMMYPRLKLLHKLLADDGAIFISIDDNEQANLKLVCDEIFGARNYLGLISRKQSSGSKNDTGNSKVITTADYILPYKKNNFEFIPYQIKNNKKFNLSDEIGFFSTRALEMQGGGDTLPQRTKMGYTVYYHKTQKTIQILFDYDLSKNPVYEQPNEDLINNSYTCYRPRKRGNEYGIWRWGAETFIERFNNNLVHFDKDRVFIKEREAEFVNKYPEALIEDYLNTQGTNELKEIFDFKTFDFPKPSELIKFICSVSTNKNSIILDSFAGSGTTAHAVLNLNKQDGGNRKFICIEMEDYAETITAERVKRVIKKMTIDDLGLTNEKIVNQKSNIVNHNLSFDFYELGQPMFLEDGNLNELVGVEKIRQYVFYTETKDNLRFTNDDLRIEEIVNQKSKIVNDNKHFLGKNNDTAYYFHYEQDEVTTLDHAFLATMKTKAEQYVIYADNCLLTKEYMTKHHIIFKKIPRDITRF